MDALGPEGPWASVESTRYLRAVPPHRIIAREPAPEVQEQRNSLLRYFLRSTPRNTVDALSARAANRRVDNELLLGDDEAFSTTMTSTNRSCPSSTRDVVPSKFRRLRNLAMPRRVKRLHQARASPNAVPYDENCPPNPCWPYQ